MVKLKLIASIKEKSKISTKNNRIENQRNSILPEFFWRMVNGDNRIDGLNEIKDIIYTAIELSNNIISSTHVNIYDIKSNDVSRYEKDKFYEECGVLRNFSTGLEETCTGIMNFCDTYNSDANIVTNIEILLKKIKLQITKIESKLELVKYSKKKYNDCIE